MSSNVGLDTPRGSGTSGYVQRSSAFLRPRDDAHGAPTEYHAQQHHHHRARQPDAAILEHDRRRRIEVQVFELRDRLEEQGDKDEDEIDDACDALRKELQGKSSEERMGGAAAAAAAAGGGAGKARLKSHQVHEIARAKIQEDEKLRRALGISKGYEEGSHWRRHEERKKGGDAGQARRPVVEEARGESKEQEQEPAQEQKPGQAKESKGQGPEPEPEPQLVESER